MKNNTDKKRFRVGLLFKDSSHCGESFDDRKQADEYILTQTNIKQARILDRETDETEIVEEI